MLENVRLKVEAFDYLQLPFVFTEGCIGRLEVQARTRCTSTMVDVRRQSVCTLIFGRLGLLKGEQSCAR